MHFNISSFPTDDNLKAHHFCMKIKLNPVIRITLTSFSALVGYGLGSANANRHVLLTRVQGDLLHFAEDFLNVGTSVPRIGNL